MLLGGVRGRAVVGPAVVYFGKRCIFAPLLVCAPPPLSEGLPGSFGARGQRMRATVGLREKMKGDTLYYSASWHL